jgi:hypothetical protein
MLAIPFSCKSTAPPELLALLDTKLQLWMLHLALVRTPSAAPPVALFWRNTHEVMFTYAASAWEESWFEQLFASWYKC